jgi:hypothetical protein
MQKSSRSGTRKSGPLSQHVRGVDGAFAAKAHIAIYPSAKQAAGALGHHIATEHRHRLTGPPALTLYLKNARDKWRLAAHMAVLVREETVDQWTRPQLIERFRELQADFAQTLVQTMDMGAPEVDRAAADEKLSALASERAAIRVRFAREGLTEADIWGQR